MKVYISGPITGTNDYLERFNKAESHLIDLGYTVVNPALVNSNLPKGTTWSEYMEMSLCMLKMCDAIYLMKGWENSRGCIIEKNFAEGYEYMKIMEEK